MQNQNYNGAQLILNNNPRLKNILVNADTLNRLKHSIMALERMFTDTIDAYIKKFTDAAAASASKAATSEKNAATHESNAATSAKNASNTLTSVTSLRNETKKYSDKATQAATNAESNYNYVQQHVGGYYNTYDITIAPSAWVASSNSGYNYQAIVSCEGALENRIPMGSVYPADAKIALEAEMCMSCFTSEKKITFYADKKASTNIRIQITLFSKTA